MLDTSAIWVTIKLAIFSTGILLLLGTPLAWWLARTNSKWRTIISTLVALPLVLPPTVLGFYLLLAMGPEGIIGKATTALGVGTLPFTFAGLVVGSVIYSLPFVVNPIKNSFEAIGNSQLEAAAMLGASPLSQFFSIALPLAKSGLLSASVLGFAHTVGEFGVVLMIGGNIPEKTRVLSVAIYDHVEAMEYGNAHALSLGLLLFSFCVLWLVHRKSRVPRVLP